MYFVFKPFTLNVITNKIKFKSATLILGLYCFYCIIFTSLNYFDYFFSINFFIIHSFRILVSIIEITTCINNSVQFSRSVLSDSLQPHVLQHARPPCPSPTPGVYSKSCSSSRWCHPAISSSVIPFSSCPQSLPASGSFLISQPFTCQRMFNLPQDCADFTCWESNAANPSSYDSAVCELRTCRCTSWS